MAGMGEVGKQGRNQVSATNDVPGSYVTRNPLIADPSKTNSR